MFSRMEFRDIASHPMGTNVTHRMTHQIQGCQGVYREKSSVHWGGRIRANGKRY